MKRGTRIAIEGLRWASRLAVPAALALAGWHWLGQPGVPVPPQWNPRAALRITDPLTPFTGLKLHAALTDPALCRAVLATGAQAEPLPDLADPNPACGIANRVRILAIGATRLTPVETRCEVALRLAMWVTHELQPQARALEGSALTRLRHFSSYNCRTIRTPQGPAARMSLHATAEAIDIAGFDLADGRRLSLKRDWQGPEAAFLRAAHDGACRWFATTLGPDYNALHADHFHLQSRGWGLCR